MTNESEWHNTGSNGPAREVWVRKLGTRTAFVYALPYRYMVEFITESALIDDGIPFESLTDAKY